MTEFNGSGFGIDLPDGYLDVSTYTFVIPTKAEFNPSLVIKFEKRENFPQLKRYLSQQLNALQNGVEDFTLLSEAPGRQGDYESITVLFEWGPKQGRIRQKQCYVAVPARSTIYTLTATNLADDFEKTEKLFNSTIGSFRPK